MSIIKSETVWESQKLGDFLDYKKGKKPKYLSDEKFENALPYLDIKALEKNEFTSFGKDDDGILCDKNCLLVVWDGSRSGLPLMSKVKGLIGSTIMRLIIPDEILPKYLF